MIREAELMTRVIVDGTTTMCVMRVWSRYDDSLNVDAEHERIRGAVMLAVQEYGDTWRFNEEVASIDRVQAFELIDPSTGDGVVIYTVPWDEAMWSQPRITEELKP